ncbi:MAG: hypothetical protein KAI47_28380 [Deltaproteobacteria bacterium]|nr:hypothetical protein [Deltaproteobacteria bacterium]
MRKSLVFLVAMGTAMSLSACSDDTGGTPPKTDGAIHGEGTGPQPDLGKPVTATIPDIKAGTITAGQVVTLTGVIITAVDTFGSYANHAYVQDPAGGKNSGIFLFGPNVDGGGQLSDLNVGDKVDVSGLVQHFTGPNKTNPYKNGKYVIQLEKSVITKTGTGTAPAPVVVTASELTDEPDATAYEGVLVTVKNVKVRTAIDATYGSFKVDGNLEVANQLYGHTGVTVGDCLDVTGVADFFYFHKIYPRGATDIAPSTSCAPAKVVKISDLQDATSGDHPAANAEVKVTGVVTAIDEFPSTTTGKRWGFYIQEEGAGGPYKGIYIFHSWADTDTIKPPAAGNKVEVTGIYAEHSDKTDGSGTTLSEIKSVTEIKDLGASTIPAAISVTGPDLKVTGGDYQKYEGVLVKIDNVTVKSLAQSSDKTKTYGFVTTAGFDVKNDLFNFIGTTPPAANDTYTSITGVVGKYMDTPQVMVRSAADLVK